MGSNIYVSPRSGTGPVLELDPTLDPVLELEPRQSRGTSCLSASMGSSSAGTGLKIRSSFSPVLELEFQCWNWTLSP